MGLLDGFIEGATGYLAQQEATNTQVALQLALEKRRRMYARQDAGAARRQQRADFVEQQNLQGMEPRVGVDEQGRPALLRDQYGMDDQGAITRRIERVGDAPRVKEGKPIKIESGDSIEYRQYYSDGTFDVLNDPNTPRYKPSEGAAPARPRYRVMYENGKAIRVNLDDPTDRTPLEGLSGSAGSADKDEGPTPSAERAESNWLRGRWADIDKVKKGQPEAQKASIDRILEAAGVDPAAVYSSLPEPSMTDPWFGDPQPNEGERITAYREAAKAAIKQVSDSRLRKDGGGRTVIRTGTAPDGQRVALYSDGTIGPAPAQ